MQQNILFRVREEKYRSRINVLENLASGTTDENEVLYQIQSLFAKMYFVAIFQENVQMYYYLLLCS